MAVDSYDFSCECGASWTLPGDTPVGQRIECPECGKAIVVPGEVAAPSASATAASPATKTCDACGETILAAAKKCKHCGEFQEAPDQALAKPGLAAKAKAKTSGDEPGMAEYFVAIAFAPLGVIIGAIWAAKKQAKAKRMLQVSSLMTVILGTSAYLGYQYFFKEPVYRSAMRRSLKMTPGHRIGAISPGMEKSRGAGGFRA